MACSVPGRAGEQERERRTAICGIAAYVGARRAQPLLLDALARLDYRGYDSAGLGLVERNGGGSLIRRVCAVGQLVELERRLAGVVSPAFCGIGHTRWATHGRVSLENSHPFLSCGGELAICLNGIVENFGELSSALKRAGHRFASETDAEVVAHLLEDAYEGDLVAATLAVSRRLKGQFAFVVCHRDHSELLVGSRRHCPLLVGRGEAESFLASAAAAFLAETRSYQVPADDEVVAVRADGVSFYGPDGKLRGRELLAAEWDDEQAERAGFESFMLKEINEQPRTLARSLRRSHAEKRNGPVDGAERLLLVGCGSAYHAGCFGARLLERWARLPVETAIASEWRYQQPILTAGTGVIAISQSGETADTLAAVRLARALGAPTLAVTNVEGSQITREVDDCLYNTCGLEFGVAASKTFTSQALVLAQLALGLARRRRTLPSGRLRGLERELAGLPEKVGRFLAREHPIAEIADRYQGSPFFVYLGRDLALPIACEGALKLRELAYLPSEVYAAGEMKHGPIALLEEGTPVVAVATASHVKEKLLSNLQEVRARGAALIVIADERDEAIQHFADDVVYVPAAEPALQALLAVVPLQLLAYSLARRRGFDVDRPRNLAKTVTVE